MDNQENTNKELDKLQKDYKQSSSINKAMITIGLILLFVYGPLALIYHIEDNMRNECLSEKVDVDETCTMGPLCDGCAPPLYTLIGMVYLFVSLPVRFLIPICLLLFIATFILKRYYRNKLKIEFGIEVS